MPRHPLLGLLLRAQGPQGPAEACKYNSSLLPVTQLAVPPGRWGRLLHAGLPAVVVMQCPGGLAVAPGCWCMVTRSAGAFSATSQCIQRWCGGCQAVNFLALLHRLNAVHCADAAWCEPGSRVLGAPCTAALRRDVPRM